mgnify:CR=1 FL=1
MFNLLTKYPKRLVLAPIALLLLFAVSCGAAAVEPQIVEKQVIVEREVIREVPVEKLVVVEKEVSGERGDKGGGERSTRRKAGNR